MIQRRLSSLLTPPSSSSWELLLGIISILQNGAEKLSARPRKDLKITSAVNSVEFGGVGSA